MSRNSTAVLTLIIFVVFGFQTQEQYLSNYIFRYTTFGRVVEQYKHFDSPRAAILVGDEMNVDQTNNLVTYIQNNTQDHETIFVYPWNPEVYYLANRNNATSFDTPYGFWSDKYQDKMISELVQNKVALVILNKSKSFGGLTPDALPKVNLYITTNFSEVAHLGDFFVLSPKQADQP